jgi:hypothetical protein
MERGEPQRLDAERMEIIQPPHQPLEVADPIAIRVHKGLEIEAIDESVLVPWIFNHIARFPATR